MLGLVAGISVMLGHWELGSLLVEGCSPMTTKVDLVTYALVGIGDCVNDGYWAGQ